jgi:hypothetical protein
MSAFPSFFSSCVQNGFLPVLSWFKYHSILPGFTLVRISWRGVIPRWKRKITFLKRAASTAVVRRGWFFNYSLQAGCIIRVYTMPLVLQPVVKFIVPDWGDKVDSGMGLSHGPARLHIGWQAGTTTLCWSQLYPPFWDYRMNLAIG